MIVDDVLFWLVGVRPPTWWEGARRQLMFWGPVVSLPGLAAPVGALATLLALVVSCGVAISSLAVFLSAALTLYLLLTQVLGLSFDVLVVA